MRILTGSSGFIGSSYNNILLKGLCVPSGGEWVERYVPTHSASTDTKKNKITDKKKFNPQIKEQTISKGIRNPDVNVSNMVIEGIMTGKIINSGTIEEYYEITEEIRNSLLEEKKENEARIKRINPLTPTLLDQTDTVMLGSEKNSKAPKLDYYRILCKGKFPICTHDHPYGRVAHKSLLSRDTLKSFFKYCWDTYHEPFQIVHLASYGNHSSQRELNQTIQANILNTVNLIEAAKDYPIESFIITGTSSEYGDKKKPMKETDLLEPDTLYAATKAAQTHIALYLAKEYDLPLVVTRPFSVYGPGEADWRFIPTIIKNGFFYRKMPLAMGWHDWIYVDDYIRGVLVAEIFAKDVLKGRIVNIGTGKQYSNRSVLHKMENIMDREIQYNLVGKIRNYDKKCWVADSTVLKDLGWKPQETIDSGLLKTYNYYRRKYLLEKKRISK